MYATPFSTLISCLSLNHHFYADDTQLILSFYQSNLDSSITRLQNALQAISSWMSANLLTPKLVLTLQKLNFSSLDSNNNWLKLTPAHLTQYTLLVILASFLMNILLFLTRSALSKSCYSHICQLRCIHPYLDFKTASAIATSIVHSKLDYCNSFYYDLPEYQLNCLQLVQNSLAYAVVGAPKCSHITPSLRSLHWLKMQERIDYKILSLTYKVLTTTEPSYLHDLISLQPHRSTRSSDVILARPLLCSSLKVNNHSFCHASLRLWNELPKELMPTCR